MQLLLWNAVCYFLVVTRMDTPKSEIRWETGTKALRFACGSLSFFFVRVEQFADMGSSLPADFLFWSIHSSHDRYFWHHEKLVVNFKMTVPKWRNK